jgi:hypothetical protein
MVENFCHDFEDVFGTHFKRVLRGLRHVMKFEWLLKLEAFYDSLQWVKWCEVVEIFQGLKIID